MSRRDNGMEGRRRKRNITKEIEGAKRQSAQSLLCIFISTIYKNEETTWCFLGGGGGGGGGALFSGPMQAKIAKHFGIIFIIEISWGLWKF